MRIAVCGGNGTIGRYVADSAVKADHEVVVLSRSSGVDVATGEGLSEALRGVDVIVDTANGATIEEKPATEFFVSAAHNLQDVGAQEGVGHVVTLSIVGIDRTSFGYYLAKLAHERAATEGAVPYTIMRATQMHELPAQLIQMTQRDSRAYVFEAHVQPVAARTTGDVLRELAEGPPQGRAPDLAGPQEAELVEMGRSYAEQYVKSVTVVPDTETMAGVGPHVLLPEQGARIEGPTFEEWLASVDAAAVAA